MDIREWLMATTTGDGKDCSRWAIDASSARTMLAMEGLWGSLGMWGALMLRNLPRGHARPLLECVGRDVMTDAWLLQLSAPAMATTP